MRDSIDVFFQVAFEGGENLAGTKITDADHKSIVDIARELSERVDRLRSKKDEPTQQSARRLSALPAPLLKLMMRLGETLSYDMDLDLSRLGVPYDAFGSCMVTSVAGYGLSVGFAPLFPPGRVPIVLTVGEVRDAAGGRRRAGRGRAHAERRSDVRPPRDGWVPRGPNGQTLPRGVGRPRARALKSARPRPHFES